jgi:hypothetical protein
MTNIKKLESFNSQTKRSLAVTISHLYAEKEVPNYILKSIINRLIWTATENDDTGKRIKYFGQPYWSEGAIDLLKANIQQGKTATDNLRHEHSIPKTKILAAIESSDKSVQSIFQILDFFAHAVIVSKQEDTMLNEMGLQKELPVELVLTNDVTIIFSRYIAVKEIRIFNIHGLDPRHVNKSELVKNPVLNH